MEKNLIASLLFLLVQQFVFAQSLLVIKKPNQYLKTTIDKDDNKMVDLKKLIPTLVLDLKYATENNFTNTVLYKKATTTFLRKQPAYALLKVQQILNSKGLGLKIFDAYRPYSVTKKMWELIKDERYVANPKQGSGHNKGISVDLTIINLTTGAELNMGTPFDNFTDTAHHSFTKNLPQNIADNRMLLKNIMSENGFRPLETEWWHYSWISKENYDLLDIGFKRLSKIVD